MVNGIFVSKSALWPCPGVLLWVKTTIWSLAGVKDKLMSCSINSSAAISPREIERPKFIDDVRNTIEPELYRR